MRSKTRIRPTNKVTKLLWLLFDRGQDTVELTAPSGQKFTYPFHKYRFRQAYTVAYLDQYLRIRSWLTYRAPCGCSLKYITKKPWGVRFTCPDHGLMKYMPKAVEEPELGQRTMGDETSTDDVG